MKVFPVELSCGITLRRDRGVFTVASSDDRASQVDEIQYEPRQGPCLGSLDTGRGGLVDDLAADDGGAATRCRHWPWDPSSLSLPWAPSRSDRRAEPLRHPAGRVRTAEQLAARASPTRPPVRLELAVRMAERSEMSAHLQAALASRAVIDHAVGIIMGQNRCTADDAFEVLRATRRTATSSSATSPPTWSPPSADSLRPSTPRFS